MNKRKIIVVGPLPPPFFGVSNATRITLEGLKSKLDILHLDTSDRRENLNFGKYDLHNIYLGLKSLLDCLFLLLKKPEILYLPVSQSFPAFYRDAGFIFLGRLFNKKIIIHLRGGYFQQFYNEEKGFRKWLIRHSVSKSHRVIVLGHTLRKLFDGLVDERKVFVVSNGVDTEYFKPDFSKRNEKKFRICFISNFEIHKGWREILNCAISIKNRIGAGKFEIIMAGKWRSVNDKEFAYEFVNKNEIGDVVYFRDTITGSDKLDLLQSSHLFLMPTSYRYEGQPWAIIEAMACGLPVIASPKGCIEETVMHGKNGFIVPHDDLKMMEEYILRIIEDKSMATKMSDESRMLTQEQFSEKIFLQKLSNIFNDV